MLAIADSCGQKRNLGRHLWEHVWALHIRSKQHHRGTNTQAFTMYNFIYIDTYTCTDLCIGNYLPSHPLHTGSIGRWIAPLTRLINLSARLVVERSRVELNEVAQWARNRLRLFNSCQVANAFSLSFILTLNQSVFGARSKRTNHFSVGKTQIVKISSKSKYKNKTQNWTRVK